MKPIQHSFPSYRTQKNDRILRVSAHLGKLPLGNQRNKVEPLMSKGICCISARTWSSLIAWTQIIGGGLGFAAAILLFEELGSLKYKINTAEFRQDLRSSLSQVSETEFNEHVRSALESAYRAAKMFAVALMAISGAGSIMGAILHLGVSREKSLDITLWIILMALRIISDFACAITVSIIAQKFRAYSLFFLGNIIVNVFCMCVATKHRSELVVYKKNKSKSPGSYSAA